MRWQCQKNTKRKTQSSPIGLTIEAKRLSNGNGALPRIGTNGPSGPFLIMERKKRHADFSAYEKKPPQARRSRRKGAVTKRKKAMSRSAKKRHTKARKERKALLKDAVKKLQKQKDKHVSFQLSLSESVIKHIRMIPRGQRSKWVEGLILREMKAIYEAHGRAYHGLQDTITN